MTEAFLSEDLSSEDTQSEGASQGILEEISKSNPKVALSEVTLRKEPSGQYASGKYASGKYVAGKYILRVCVLG